MNVKQVLRTKAAMFLADHQPDLENMSATQSRERLVQALYTDMMEVWIYGVDAGATVCESVQAPVSRKAMKRAVNA